MGRRAKNKQGDPAAFSEPKERASRPSTKKLGKRKAESEVDHDADGKGAGRPAKKAKDNSANSTGSAKPRKRVDSKPSKSKGTSAKAPAPSEGESEGWEDVEDPMDLSGQAEYVLISPPTAHN
ncbi:hypothetical protein PLICRDRAFT_599770 [Plicaturopsis crispa FD-325 SS-3]|nr:hypothetical protein PLICRDRAFT_599770 [Plicaturopsis crispa FD-325 SS-3]